MSHNRQESKCAVGRVGEGWRGLSGVKPAGRIYDRQPASSPHPRVQWCRPGNTCTSSPASSGSSMQSAPAGSTMTDDVRG
ncbi:hypothetical protein RRG08_000651 [Elysia crispata]|uniref:Uncharacterized protein n=1 Tax=Elysia crispata TaxID=231223 RepID=A0AAE0Y903_9GAST|nr:hypothetical protein RRG08_000651 [Elysia crispata]